MWGKPSPTDLQPQSFEKFKNFSKNDPICASVNLIWRERQTANVQAVETLRIRMCSQEGSTKDPLTDYRGNQPTLVTEGQSDKVTTNVRTGEKQVSNQVTASFTWLNGVFKGQTRVSSEKRRHWVCSKGLAASICTTHPWWRWGKGRNKNHHIILFGNDYDANQERWGVWVMPHVKISGNMKKQTQITELYNSWWIFYK